MRYCVLAGDRIYRISRIYRIDFNPVNSGNPVYFPEEIANRSNERLERET
jgi:hypothetical protein